MPIPPKAKKGSLDIAEFMIQWNLNYPYDRWWRSKHDVPFGSPKHRQANFLDMIFEFQEDMYFRQIEEERKELDDFTPEERASLGMASVDAEGKQVIKQTKKEIDDDFKNLNLADFNDITDQPENTE